MKEATVAQPSASMNTPARSRLLQRKCACGGAPGPSGECAECRTKRLIQRRATRTVPSTVPPIVHDVLRSPGQPLDAATRSYMEPRFGRDFGQVRVHADAKAEDSARAVDALAYTAGRDIVFASGEYTPETAKGRRLLAHELAHIVQQAPTLSSVETSTTPSLRMPAGKDGASEEAEADRAATAVTVGQPFATHIGNRGRSIQRQEVTDEERRRWMGAGLQPTYRLHLDPEIQTMSFRMPELLDPEIIKASLSRMDLGSIVGYQPPPWVTAPPVSEPRPLVPSGAGPETPTAASAGDVLKALMSVPAVDTVLGRLKAETKDRISREGRRLSRDWQSSSTGGKVAQAAIITHSAVIGAGFLTGAVAGVVSDPEAL